MKAETYMAVSSSDKSPSSFLIDIYKSFTCNLYMRKIILIMIFGIFFISLISASQFAYNYLDGQNVNPGGNYTINVNNSEYFQGYTPTTLKNWIQNLFNSIFLLKSEWNATNLSYVPYVGANQNVNLGANNLTVDTNVLHVDATNDRVGIGTTSPQAKLDVQNGGVNIYLG